MQNFDRNGYPANQVIAALQAIGGGRQLRFRFELLDRNNRYLRDLQGVVSASVQQDASADIKRTASFLIRDGIDTINYLSDRIKPWVGVVMPDGGVAEWPQGVFLLSSPSKTLATSGAITRTVAAYDQATILAADRVDDRYSIAAGRPYTEVIRRLLDGYQMSVTDSGIIMPVTWDYEAGTSRLTILNDLLSAINYRSAWFNEHGYLIVEPYVLPQNRTIGYTYATDASSTFVGDIVDDLDLFDVPNYFVLIVSDTDRGSFRSVYANTSPSSPTSIPSRGRTIVQYEDGQTAADQATLDALAMKMAYEASQVYESVTFNTLLMPFHTTADILGISVDGLQLGSVKFEELSWSMDLRVGGQMSHVVRRTVTV